MLRKRPPDERDTAAHLEQRGVDVVRDHDFFPGHRRCYAADPVGNRLEFIQRNGDVASW